MSKVRTVDTDANIRVALVIEQGKLKPVWFEQTDKASRERIFIKDVCSTGHYHEGATKIITFSVWDGANSYRLSLNTRDFSWTLGITEWT